MLLALRINVLAKGYSGISPKTLRSLPLTVLLPSPSSAPFPSF
jgi:histidine ammonia-lyase